MAVQTHTLIDAATDFVSESFDVAGKAAGNNWYVRLRTCRGGKSEGVRVVELHNGAMSIDVLPTRGMGIWRVRRGDKTLGWQAPAREPVHPSFVPLMEPAGLGWLDGFNELLCRCGLESNGPPEFDDAGRLLRPLHGRVANTPARRVELIIDEAAGLLTLRGVVEESRFLFQSLRLTASVTTALGSNEFTWMDEVENLGGRPAMLQMLYHFNIGQPLLRPGAEIIAPVAAVAPHTAVAASEGVERWNVMPGPRPDSSEQVYLLDLAADDASETAVLVRGLTGEQAIRLRFNKQELPCFTVWRNTPAEQDGYVLGIEPGTNYPNPRTFEDKQGRVVRLAPGQRWSATVSAAWLESEDAIAREQAAIGKRATNAPQVAPKPRADWSVGA
jgi:hypothetical protein